MNSPEYSTVCEVGNFGSINIDDPTTKKVKAKDENVEDLIAEAVKENAANLSKK